MPNSSSSGITPGIKPSPQALSPSVSRASMTIGLIPARAANKAAASPTGPPPTIATRVPFMSGSLVPCSRRGFGNRAGRWRSGP